MSRSYFPTTLIPRSFFPARIGDAMSLKDGTEVTVGSDRKNISTFFWLTDKKTKARVSLYFNHNGEFPFRISRHVRHKLWGCVERRRGRTAEKNPVPCTRKIRTALSGKRACKKKVEKVRPPAKKPLPAIYNKSHKR